MEPKKNPKADLTKNSSLYFVIGLFAVMLFTYVAFEWKTYDEVNDYDISMNVDDLLDEEKSDSFIIYNNGQIAFDKWYPEKVSNHLIKNIINKFKDDPKSEAQKQVLQRYIDLLD